MLTNEQQIILVDALLAETDPSIVAAIASRLDDVLVSWVNTQTVNDAWMNMAYKIDLFDAIDLTKYNNITAGSRDTWKYLNDMSPIDFGIAKRRQAIVDVWGTTDSVVILQKLRRKATKGEMYFGGTVVTTNTVSALKLNFPGLISKDDMAYAFNVQHP